MAFGRGRDHRDAAFCRKAACRGRRVEGLRGRFCIGDAVTADDIESALLKFERSGLPVGRRIIERAPISAPICKRPDRRGTRPTPGATAPRRR